MRPEESLIVAIHCSDCGLEPGLDLALGSRGEARIEVEDWGRWWLILTACGSARSMVARKATLEVGRGISRASSF